MINSNSNKMKRYALSFVTVMAMSSFAVAGGDVDPVEPNISTPDPVVVPPPSVTIEDRGFYLGMGYGFLDITRETLKPGDTNNYTQGSGNYDQIMLQAGYKFNPYIALEGRTWLGLGSNTWAALSDKAIQREAEIDVWGIYVKPMYPITEKLDIYGLLGYGNSSLDIKDYYKNDLDGFSYGVGGAYDFNANWSMFVDYALLYDGQSEKHPEGWKVNNKINITTVGLSYKF